MRIECPACHAKYSIADEKVEKRLAKIRCRKCASTLVIDGHKSPPAVHVADVGVSVASKGSLADSGKYNVDLADNNQPQMSVEEIVEAFREGRVTPDTYVWREGMEDWKPLTDVPDIAKALKSFRGTVLLIEADDEAFSANRKALEQLGASVLRAADAEGGMACAREERPDIILLTIELPRMNGFSVCSKLKRDPELKQIPLILLSSEATAETYEQHKRLRTRADGYLHKPVAADQLRSAVLEVAPFVAVPDRTSRPVPESPTGEEEVAKIFNLFQLTQDAHATEQNDGPRCDRCGTVNRPGLRYCVTCGNSLPEASDIDINLDDETFEHLPADADASQRPKRRPCPNCRKLNAPHYKYCLGCGIALPPPSEPETPQEHSSPPLPTSHRSVPADLRVSADGRISIRENGAWLDGVVLPLDDPAVLRARLGEAYPSDLQSIGTTLFQALTASRSFAAAYQDALARASADEPLRIVLRMHPDEASPGVCSVAEHFWETLYDKHNTLHLAIARKCLLVRQYGDLEAKAPTSPTSSLQVSVALSSPMQDQDGGAMPALNQCAEQAAFRELHKQFAPSGLLNFDVILRFGLEQIDQAMGHSGMFHFSGHGRPGALLLDSRSSRAVELGAGALRQALASPTPRVAVLNCCRGSVASGAQSNAAAFLAGGVLGVVAMTGDLADPTALKLTQELYLRIAGGNCLEAAVQRVRWHLFAERAADWYMPTVWTRATSDFALVTKEARERNAAGVSTELERLEREAARLEPRVALTERITKLDITLRLSSEQQRRLVDQLETRLPERAEDLDAAVDGLLGDRTLVEELASDLPKSDGNAALLETLAAVRVDLVPQLSHLVKELPALIELFKGPSVDEDEEPVLLDQLRAPDPRHDPPLTLPAKFQDLAALERAATGDLIVPEGVVERCLLHLLAGRHLVLTGPPGTGKSTLAENLAKAFGFGAKMATANPDWTTFDVIGGLFPVAKRDRNGRVHLSYTMRPGCVTSAVSSNWAVAEDDPSRTVPAKERCWLVLDEMNRAPMDQAFGDLFTGLVSGKLAIPRVGSKTNTSPTSALHIPKSFRIIGTLNTADRHLLFQMSEALKRRFAFVEVPAFPENQRRITDTRRLFRQVSKRPAVGAHRRDDTHARLSTYLELINPIIERIRVLHPLGTAQIIDALVCCYVGGVHQSKEASEVVAAALPDQFLPLLESHPSDTLKLLASLLDGQLSDCIRSAVGGASEAGEDLSPQTCYALREVASYISGNGASSEWREVASSISEQLAEPSPQWSGVYARLAAGLAPLEAPPGAEKLAAELRKVASQREH